MRLASFSVTCSLRNSCCQTLSLSRLAAAADVDAGGSLAAVAGVVVAEFAGAVGCVVG
jgi:hypothetical protein